MTKCVLCEALKEDGIYEDELIKILETKTMKGHKRRIMIISKEHIENPAWMLERYMLDQLENIGKLVFNYTYKFVIMSPMFGKVKNHAHFVASDLEPDSDDHHQILGTPWIKVVEVKLWK